jgi:hypothetical protein
MAAMPEKLKKLPFLCRAGDNFNAFLSGFRLREKPRETADANGTP